MFKFRCFFLATVLMSTSMLFAVEADKSIEQKLATLKLERMQAQFMVKLMERRGRLNQKEVAHATRSIASIQEEDVKLIRSQAVENIKSKNSLATK